MKQMERSTDCRIYSTGADEVQTTENAEWLNLVLNRYPEKWEASAGNLLPVMVKPSRN